MIFDTNLVLFHIRHRRPLPSRTILSAVTEGELKSLALRNGWGIARTEYLRDLLLRVPVFEVDSRLTDWYARVETFSQGALPNQPLPPGLSARNMSKNDLWIAATAFYFDTELHTTDSDFDHLPGFGLKLVKIHPASF